MPKRQLFRLYPTRYAIIMALGGLLVTATGTRAEDVAEPAANYYSWTDKDGVLHMGDRPPAGAEVEVTIGILPPAGSNIPAPPEPAKPPAPPSPPTATPAKNATPATKVTLLSPPDQATVRNNNGQITIDAGLDNPLGGNQKVRVVIDGRPGLPQTATQWQLGGIARGSHHITVELMENGKVIASSAVVTLYLHRSRVKPPQPAPL